MTAYRRNFIPGGCFFFTVNLADRRLRLLTENVETLRFAIRETRQRHPFTIDAMVVLPVAVGWVERSETHQFVTQAGHDRVPSQFHPWRLFLFYGQPCRSATAAADRTC